MFLLLAFKKKKTKTTKPENPAKTETAHKALPTGRGQGWIKQDRCYSLGELLEETPGSDEGTVESPQNRER